MLSPKQTLQAGATFGFLSVAVGAFGAHALKPTLISHGSLDTFELAVRYQFFHALALLIIGVMMEKINTRVLSYSATLMVAGILLFSGSLYALAFQAGKAMAFATPIGGVCFLAGWILLFLSVRAK